MSPAFSASGEVKSTTQWSPSTLYHWAPASQDRSTSVDGSSPAMLKILTFLFSFCAFSPAAMRSSQVFGASMPYFSNRSAR